MRLLEKNNIPYDTLTYPTITRDAVEVAELVGLPPQTVYKTLVVLPSSETRPRPILALLAANQQLALKKLAKAAGYKKVMMARHAEAEGLTRLQVGGISPLALVHKNWSVYADRTMEEYDRICLSGGERGIQIRLATSDLIALLNIQVADIAAETP